MNGREFWALSDVSNDELVARLSGLLGEGARLEARIVAHLAEVEARRLHLLLGCASLYDYCRKRIGLSDYEAFVRIAAARVARKFPIVFGMLERRELHLTAICEVREYLTAENHRELLEEVSGKTKLQIRGVLARRFPQADTPVSLKKLPTLEPLSPGRYRLLLTLNAEQKEKLELARDLLSHANSTGDLAGVLERALDELISRLEQRRFGQTQRRSNCRDEQASEPLVGQQRADKPKVNKLKLSELKDGQPKDGQLKDGQPKDGEPRISEPIVDQLDAGMRSGIEPKVATSGLRQRKHIAHAVRRELLARDGGRCTFVGCDGTRCDARAFLQFHHRQAWARGGGDTDDNLTLLCYAHNRLLAEQDFGQAHIGRAVAGRNAERSIDQMTRRMGQPMHAVSKQQQGGKPGRI